MRYLHLLYIILFLAGRGIVGQKILRRHGLPLAALVCSARRRHVLVAAPDVSRHTTHRMAGAKPGNAWVEAFQWIRRIPCRQPVCFGPLLHETAGRGLSQLSRPRRAERVADYVKDPSVATQVPSLSARWKEEVDAQDGWRDFRVEDFQRLRRRFGVNWVVLVSPGAKGMDCPSRITW